MFLENYNPKDYTRFKQIIDQSGGRLGVDRYIYNQSGHGIGTFFSKLFRTIAPVAGKVLRKSVKTLQPHLKKIGKQALAVGGEIVSDELNKVSNKIQNNLQKTRPGKRKRAPDAKPLGVEKMKKQKGVLKMKKQKDVFETKKKTAPRRVLKEFASIKRVGL